MDEIAGWVAPAATMIAATMTAANLGARVTGWGFVVFAIGSIAWTVVAMSTDQPNLLWTNGFLLLVNTVGIWRWLGRQARYEDGSQAAAAESAEAAAPTLLPVGGLAGRKVTGPDGEPIGVVVEAMMRCADARLAYVVLSEGGVGGIGERLHALDPRDLRFTPDSLTTPLRPVDLAARPVLEPGAWPAQADPPGGEGRAPWPVGDVTGAAPAKQRGTGRARPGGPP